MAVDIAQPAEQQWERDLVELFGLDRAAGSPRLGGRGLGGLGLGGREVRRYAVIMAAAVAVAAVPAFLLMQRPAPKTFAGASIVRRAAIAPVVAGLPDHGGSTAMAADEPVVRSSLPNDDAAGAAAQGELTQQRLGSLPVKPALVAGAGAQGYGSGRHRSRRVTADVMAAPVGTRMVSATTHAIALAKDQPTIALPGPDVSRSTPPGDHLVASRTAPAASDPGAAALPPAAANPGFVRADSAVPVTSSLASGDKVQARNRNRRTSAIDALRLLRRQ